jgi:hypothetical protein
MAKSLARTDCDHDPVALQRNGAAARCRRLPETIVLASPCTRPYRFRTPTLAVKSSISSLSRTPVLAAVTLAPNQSFSVYA